RQRPGRGSAWRRRGGGTAPAGTERAVRIHLRRHPADRGRNHGRQLRHARRRRRPVRCSHPAVDARRAAHAPLTGRGHGRIGDRQGCYGATRRLLDAIAFDPACDRLWFCGDLVNRGGESLETLRLVHSLRAHAVTVLGNHDLSLLAIAQRTEAEQRKVNPDLQRVLFAEDRDELLGWLQRQPLVYTDRQLGWLMVHAGLAPKWTTRAAEQHAREVERKLAGSGAQKLLRNMYGDHPAWSPRLAGTDRDRAIINVFTRMRYCSPRGRIAFEEKGPPGTQAPGLYPWFEVPGRVE